MKIYFNEVSIKPKVYKQNILKSVSSLLDKGRFLNGQENQKLINNLRRFLGKGSVVLTASGHDALLYALQALHLSSRDEVIFPVNAYPTAFPIAQSGVKPVPVDVDQNGLIDPKQIVKKITKNTKAIVIVHLYGLVADVDGIKQLIKNKKIILIEDCAQAFGSTYKGKPVGTFGDISCFSFYPTKNLATLGDGGALWTKNKKFCKYFQQAISYGEKRRYQSEFIAGHSRLPEIQAGILNVYLRTINKDLQKRKRVFSYYQNLFATYKLNDRMKIIYDKQNSKPALHMLVIETQDRDGLKNYLRRNGLETLVHYPLPIHLLPAFSHLKFKRGDFPTAERLANNVLSLPFHSYLTKKQVEFIVKSIRNFYYG